jgi:hypothetical protein
MVDTILTCPETPLAWPPSVALEDVPLCTTCSLIPHISQSGSLQILTRRQGNGVGDGVNIEEATSIGIDYRGQRYTYDEAIFHVPGLHVFPGQSSPYPAEYHIHFYTLTEPQRAITIVIPVSHMVTGPGVDYFAACAAQPDPSSTRPMLSTLLPPGSTVSYRGTDIRGRTASDPTTPACSSTNERIFILVLQPVQIRASDLERIPREGSLSTDPRDLPAPGVEPSQAVTRDRLMMTVVATPQGILAVGSPVPKPSNGEATIREMECKPLEVVDGRDVINVNGQTIDIKKLLDISGSAGAAGKKADEPMYPWMHAVIFFVAILGGIFLTDYIATKVFWNTFFTSSPLLNQWEPFKIYIYLGIAATAAGFSQSISDLF